MKSEHYYIVFGWMHNELELKGTELNVYAIIHGFSRGGEFEFKGTRNYIAQTLNVSLPTIDRAISILIERGLIEKRQVEIDKIRYNMYRNFVPDFEGGYKETLGGVRKETLQGGSKETLSDPRKETLHNNTNRDNTSIDNNTGHTQNSVTLFPELEDKKTNFKKSIFSERKNFEIEIIRRYPDMTVIDFDYYFREISEWGKSKPNTLRNSSGWGRTIRTWVQKEQDKGKLKLNPNSTAGQQIYSDAVDYLNL